MTTGQVQYVAFESSGVRLRLDGDAPEVLDRLPALLPPDARPIPPEQAEESFGLIRDGGAYAYVRGESPVSVDVDLDFGLSLLQTQVRLYIGLHAPNRIFIHAGAVAHQGRAILIPGRSFTGKTSLVGAFLQAGATYYSDEFAVLDETGLVHPYPTPLSFRLDAEVRRDVSAADLGSTVGVHPIPVGAIVVTQFQPDGVWSPQELTRGKAAIQLLDNALAALARHDEILPVLRMITEDAIMLQGDRGEPAALIADVLARLDARAG